MTDFFDLENGSFGKLYYYKKVEISPDQERSFVDQQARMLSRTFDPPIGLSSDEYSSLFLNHYIKSRNESKKALEQGSSERDYIDAQIGNRESIQEIESLERSKEFERWENPEMVKYLLNFSKSFL